MHSQINNTVRFGCDIELLQINGKIPIFHDDQPYFRKTIMSKTEIEWNIGSNITRYFKQASNGEGFYSPDIDHIWCLSCHLNVTDAESKGQLILGLELIRLPPKVRAIEINFGLKAVHNNTINASYQPKKGHGISL